MIDRFSPLTRRMLALGGLVLALLVLVNLVLSPLVGLTGDSLTELDDARFRLARLEAIIARPAPPRSEPVPDSLYAAAPARQAATDRLISMINTTASGYGVQVDSIAPMDANPSRPKMIALSLVMRGEQDAMLAFINDLERGQPVVHFADWSLGPGAQPAAAAADPEGQPGAIPPATDPKGPSQLTFAGTAAIIWDKRP
jgi:hypothetical protein